MPNARNLNDYGKFEPGKDVADGPWTYRRQADAPDGGCGPIEVRHAEHGDAVLHVTKQRWVENEAEVHWALVFAKELDPRLEAIASRAG